MKIVQINSVPNASTGRIMMGIHEKLIKQNYESYVVWGRGRVSENENEIYMNDKIGTIFHVLYTRLTGKTGFASKKATKKLISRLERIKPSIIHLHNIHGYYINIDLLFEYLRKENIPVVWTFHDCWAFTGQCPHFLIKKCNKWQTECCNCPMINEYPKTIHDNSKWNYSMKKAIFTSLKNMTIVTPSKWLAGLVDKSFFKNYKIEIINNGIDTTEFKHISSNVKERLNINDKKIILGVANKWDARKGLNDFIDLSKILSKDYVIVLVGLNEKQIKSLPDNVIGIKRTNNPKELVELYSSADVFFNPTYEDTFPTVNMEALACGTNVITYNTGGVQKAHLWI